MNFNHEELMLMMLYNTGTRMGLIHELRLMQCYLMRSLPNWNFPRTDFCRLRAAYIKYFVLPKDML